MKRIAGYYTVETALVMSLILPMIFAVVTYTLKLYKKVEDYGKNCVYEVSALGPSTDSMRLERLMSGIFEK
ncbi:MAG: hypothetical protein IJS80_06190 [Lachnospiraceae bacterium]|nr:hypothetical protein [Lachnospiraceae bacterium]